MEFEQLAREAGRELSDSAGRVEAPLFGDVVSGRRRVVLASGAAVVALLVAAVVAATSLGGGPDTLVGSGTADSTVVTATTVAGEPASAMTVDLLDGSRLEVQSPVGLHVGGFRFSIDRPELGGMVGVGVSPVDDPAQAAVAESAEFEEALGEGITLWRGHRAGQPIFMSVDLGGWVVFLNVGYETPPGTEFLLSLAHELRGEPTSNGVVLPNHQPESLTVHLGGPGDDQSVALGIGQCLREMIPGSGAIEHPRRGEVIRADGYASWCDTANDLEVMVYGEDGFVEPILDGLTLRRSAEPSEPTETSISAVTSTTRSWSTFTSVVDGRTAPRQALVGSDGTIMLPEGLYPLAISDTRAGLVVAAQRVPIEEGEPPHEEGTVLAIDPATGEIRWRQDLDGGPTRVATSDKAAWVAHFWTGAVTKLDLHTGQALSTVVVELPFAFGDESDRDFIPYDMEVAFGSLWVSSGRGAVAEIDLESGAVVEVTAIYSGDTFPVGELEATGHDMWVAADAAGVFRIAPDDHSTELIGLAALDHTGSSLVFHDGTMFVGGNRLQRERDGGFVISDGSYISADDSQVTRLNPDGLETLGAVELPSPNATLLLVDDQLLAWDGHSSLWPIDQEPVAARSQIRFKALATMAVGDTGPQLWLLGWSTGDLKPVSSETLLSSVVSGPHGR